MQRRCHRKLKRSLLKSNFIKTNASMNPQLHHSILSSRALNLVQISFLPMPKKRQISKLSRLMLAWAKRVMICRIWMRSRRLLMKKNTFNLVSFIPVHNQEIRRCKGNGNQLTLMLREWHSKRQMNSWLVNQLQT